MIDDDMLDSQPCLFLPTVHKKQNLQSNVLGPKFYAQAISSPNTRSPGFTINDQKASLLNPQ